MIIRQFKPKDYGGFAKVLKSVGSLHNTESYKAIMKTYKHNPDLILVAEDKGQIIGTVIGQGDGRIGFVWSLAVLPSEQGKGAGKKLMLEIERRLRKMGCMESNLFTSTKRKVAINMYKKMGYKKLKNPYVMVKDRL